MLPGRARLGPGRPGRRRSASRGWRRAPAAGEVKVSGCEARDPHPLLPVPSFSSSPSPSDVWSWQLGRFRIPDPSPPRLRARYIAGADATRPAARHSLREGRSAAATGGAGGDRGCSGGGGGAGAAAAPGPGRAWAAGGSGTEWARRLQPGSGPGGAASASGFCTAGLPLLL